MPKGVLKKPNPQKAIQNGGAAAAHRRVPMTRKPPTFASRMHDGLFIGTVHAALDPGFLFTNKITHIVNTAGSQVMNRFEGMGISYLSFNWQDTDMAVILDSKDANIEAIAAFIQEALDAAEGVLIHSVRGASRSCAVLVAYLVKNYGWPVEVAMEFVRRKVRKPTRPAARRPRAHVHLSMPWRARRPPLFCGLGERPGPRPFRLMRSHSPSGSRGATRPPAHEEPLVDSSSGSWSQPVLLYQVLLYLTPVAVVPGWQRPEVAPKPAFVRQLKAMRKRQVRRRNQTGDHTRPFRTRTLPVLHRLFVVCVPLPLWLRQRPCLASTPRRAGRAGRRRDRAEEHVPEQHDHRNRPSGPGEKDKAQNHRDTETQRHCLGFHCLRGRDTALSLVLSAAALGL